jgi:hypothetical protein
MRRKPDPARAAFLGFLGAMLPGTTAAYRQTDLAHFVANRKAANPYVEAVVVIG